MNSIRQNPKATAPSLLFFAVPFVLVLGISLEGGGFDPLVFGQVGVIVWWMTMLGAIAGVATLGDLPRSAWLVLAAMGAFVIWTGMSMFWSESAGRSGLELARASTYLGVLVLTLTASGPRDRRGPILGGVAAAIGAVAVIALLARMQPDVFPRNDTIDIVGAARTRLNFPLDYWNGLAGLIAIGLPLLLHFAVAAPGRLRWRALASATLPAAGLAMYLTLSRGGALAAGCALVLLLWLHPARGRLLAQLLVAGAAAAVLIVVAEAQIEFMAGVRAGAGLTQGDWLVALLALISGLLAFWPWLAERIAVTAGARKIEHYPRPGSSRGKIVLVGGVITGLIIVALALGAPERISQRWDQFKDPEIAAEAGRLASASGNGRYQWWRSALDAGEEQPLLGIGAGTFSFWWLREATFPSQVTDAHSLYLESLAELGIVGFLLIVAVIGGSLVLIVADSRRTRGGAGDPRRGQLAAAGAAVLAFAVTAGIDWAWELPSLPISVLLVIGAALGTDGIRATSGGGSRPRLALVALALAGVLAIVPALLGLDRLRASQEQFRAGNLEAALDQAELARRFEPYSATAALQEAIVLQKIGDLRGAVASAREATEKEPTNWSNWLVLARFERILGENRGASDAARREAERLNPSSALFR